MAEQGIKPNHYRKWLNQIWDDLVELMSDFENPQFEVTKLEHYISWSEGGKRFFLVTTLPETPRVGSMVDIGLFHPITGSHRSYYVDDISYEIDEGKMIVNISLRSELFNAYAKFEEEKEEYEEYKRGFWHWMDWRKRKREEFNQI